MFELTLRSGATPRDLATVARTMPPAVYLDHRPASRRDTDVILIFRENPAGAEISHVAPGWTPQVGTAAGPDRGLTPHQMAMAELITAADDAACGARILALVTRADPAEVMALADVMRARRGPRCGHRHGGTCG
ncbi:hypothetical protein I6A60_41035 [Frankia sp. AgB1.9]|nr:hypothetical protein [Frankia sp. AgW1.1]MBL7554163.1 hypothetical protein [Frankia sp. AgB1.9]MBL7618539.1 hypothetical protein [Frankia sp. AgB1.8]